MSKFFAFNNYTYIFIFNNFTNAPGLSGYYFCNRENIDVKFIDNNIY